MPARKKSLTLLKLSGGLKAHPGRYKDRTEVACPDGIGEPPSQISISRKHLWAEIVASLPVGHLQSADRLLLEIVTHLIQREFPRLCRGGSSSLTFAGVHPRNSER